MPQKKRGKLSRKKIAGIAVACVAVAVAIAIIITNIFIPVKYLTSYMVFSDNKNTAGQMRVNFLDVGNGDCTVVELPDGKTLLIDGGDGTYTHNLKVLKELNSRKICNIDYLVCSSVENGSCGGLAEILTYKTVGRIFAPYCPVTYISEGYRTFCEKLAKENKNVEICEYGAGVFDDGADYRFCFLSPDAHLAEGGEYEALINNPTDRNIRNASAVIWIEYGGVGFLLLGGTSRSVQSKILKNLELADIEIGGRVIDIKGCDVLKLSDHGSEEGAYAPLSDYLSPKEAVISVGKNGMGYPSLAALANAQNCVGRNIYRTDECGTVTFIVRDGSYEIVKEKK